MIDVIGGNIAVQVLDAIARAAIGSGCSGCSNRLGVAAIHVVDEGQNVAKATSIISNWNTLLIAATQDEIDADGVDTSIITHTTPDASLDYIVMLGDVVYSSGEVTAIAGVVTLNLSTDTPGTYTVWLARKAGNYATGSYIIEAVE